jgi:tRNA(fMet)-specific endonuclease VapC
MIRILLDTNAYVAFKSGDEEVVEIIRLAEQIAISVVVMAELLAGFVTGSREKRNRLELSEFMASPRVNLLAIDQETTEYYARAFRQLRESGRPIPTNDLWIAATALQHGFGVCTLDRHFDLVENLLVCRTPADMLP